MTDRDSGTDGGRAPDEDLTALVEELSATLESLQEAVRAESPGGPVRPSGPRTPPGPRPPSPRELLRFTEQYTIPTLIALLESGVRSLELLRATLRLLDGRRFEDASPATRERVESVGRTTLDRVDAVLSDLGSAVEGGEPSDPDARDLLADARALREEIDRRIREAESGERGRDGTSRRTTGRRSDEGRDIPVRSADRSGVSNDVGSDDAAADAGSSDAAVDAGSNDAEVDVDVDSELESIREDVARERGDVPTDDGDGDEGDGVSDPDGAE